MSELKIIPDLTEYIVEMLKVNLSGISNKEEEKRFVALIQKDVSHILQRNISDLIEWAAFEDSLKGDTISGKIQLSDKVKPKIGVVFDGMDTIKNPIGKVIEIQEKINLRRKESFIGVEFDNNYLVMFHYSELEKVK